MRLSPEKRLYVSIFYSGPWDRLAHWLWKSDTLVLDEEYNRLSGGVKDGSLRDRLGLWASDQDHRWMNKWMAQGKMPPDRWKKK